MPFVRVVLFVVILLLLAAAALLWLPFSDEEVPEAINKGSRRLQEEAIELHREGWDALKETRKEINKMSDGLREQSGPLREEISKAGREQLETLREKTGVAKETIETFPRQTQGVLDELQAFLVENLRALRVHLLDLTEDAEESAKDQR